MTRIPILLIAISFVLNGTLNSSAQEAADPLGLAQLAKAALAPAKHVKKSLEKCRCKKCKRRKECRENPCSEACNRQRHLQKCREKHKKKKEEKCKKLEAEEKKKEAEEQIAMLEVENKLKELKLKEEELDEALKPWDVADKENLEDQPDPPNDGNLLKLAARAKIHQDLAPKKIEALNYLASLGCVKDPRVTDAILDGMKDFNEDVRAAAVMAVITSHSGPEYAAQLSQSLQAANGNGMQWTAPSYVSTSSRRGCRRCRGQGRLKQMFRRTCGSCRGRGCAQCNGYGQVIDVQYYSCDACTTSECAACEFSENCKYCCEKIIVDELKKMAFDPHETKPNCYYEPSEYVRELAAEAYNLCPQPKEKRR